MIGGFALNTLKKLKGARLMFPFESIVDAKAIGLGPTEPSKYRCNFGISISFGLIDNMTSKYEYKNSSNIHLAHLKHQFFIHNILPFVLCDFT